MIGRIALWIIQHGVKDSLGQIISEVKTSTCNSDQSLLTKMGDDDDDDQIERNRFFFLREKLFGLCPGHPGIFAVVGCWLFYCTACLKIYLENDGVTK